MARRKKYTSEVNRAYGIYKKTYHKAIIGHQNEYRERMTKKEFSQWYRDAKLAPISKKHPIKSIVQAQKYTDSKEFVEYYKTNYGNGRLNKGFRESSNREQAWIDFIYDLQINGGLNYADAKEKAKEYFGY